MLSISFVEIQWQIQLQNLLHLLSVSSLLGHGSGVSLLTREVLCPFSATPTMALGPTQLITNGNWTFLLWETESLHNRWNSYSSDCAEICYYALDIQHQESLGTWLILTFNLTCELETIDIYKTSNFSKNKWWYKTLKEKGEAVKSNHQNRQKPSIQNVYRGKWHNKLFGPFHTQK